MREGDAMYGSDANGMVWGYRFSPGRPAEQISSDVAATSLDPPEGGFLWLHFSVSNVASERWLRQHLSLPDAFYESLHGETISTHLELDDDLLVASVHDVLFDFAFDPDAVATISLCIGPRLLVSARRRPLRSVDQLRAEVRAAKQFRSSLDLLVRLLRDQADVLVGILRQTTHRVNQIEDRVLADRLSASRTELGNLRRVLVRLQRLLAPEPAAMFRLLSRPPAWMSLEDVQDLQEAAEEFAVAVGDSGALVERVRLLQEEMAALVNEQTNNTLFVLTMVTVLALPVNMVAGLFGMNVGGIPLAQHGSGFVWIVLALLALTAVLAYLSLGRRRG